MGGLGSRAQRMISGPRTLFRKLKIGPKLVSDDALDKAGSNTQGSTDLQHTHAALAEVEDLFFQLEPALTQRSSSLLRESSLRSPRPSLTPLALARAKPALTRSTIKTSADCPTPA